MSDRRVPRLSSTKARSSSSSVNSPFGCTRNLRRPSSISPAETEKFNVRSLPANWSRPMPFAVNRSGITAISTSFCGAPWISTLATPGMRSMRRLKLRSSRSYSRVMSSVLLDRRSDTASWSELDHLNTM